MKIFIAFFLTIFCSINIYSQDTTLQQVELKEINIIDFNDDKDPLNEYFIGNRFSLIEKGMERIPAISLISRGNYAAEPIVRGFSGGQVNLSIDGMHIFGACTDKMDPVSSYVETANLKEIEAGNSTELSSNGAGLAACIDMKTANPDYSNKKFYGNVASGFQSSSKGISTSLGMGFNQRHLSGLFSATFRSNENYKDGNGNRVNYTQFSKANFSAKLASSFSRFYRIKLSYIYDRAWDVGYAALPMDVSLAEANIYSLGLERYFFSSVIKEINLTFYGNNIYHEMDDSQRPDVPIRMDMPGWSTTYGSFMNLKLREVNGHQFLFKADGFVHFARAEMTMYTSDSEAMFMLTWPDIRRMDVAAFVSDQWRIKEGFKVDYSLRFDYASSGLQSEFAKDHLRVFGFDVDDPIKQSIYNLVINPNWNVNESWNLSLITALKQRLPTISELYGFYLYNAQDGYDYIGNPDLNPESALQFEIELTYNRKALSFSLSSFYYHIDDYIVGIINSELSPMTIAANGIKVYDALPNAYMTGFEVSALWNTSGFSWLNVLNFTYGKDSNKEILAQLPPLKLISTFTIKAKNWDLSPELVAAAKKDQVRISFGEKSAPGWMVFNLRASYYLKKNWSLQGGIENLFNNYYYEFLDWGMIPRQGINFYINASFKF